MAAFQSCSQKQNPLLDSEKWPDRSPTSSPTLAAASHSWMLAVPAGQPSPSSVTSSRNQALRHACCCPLLFETAWQCYLPINHPLACGMDLFTLRCEHSLGESGPVTPVFPCSCTSHLLRGHCCFESYSPRFLLGSHLWPPHFPQG